MSTTTDPDRLRVAGNDRDRELFERARGEPGPVPEALRREVAASLAAALAPRPRRRVWAVALGVGLAAGSALALTFSSSPRRGPPPHPATSAGPPGRAGRTPASPPRPPELSPPETPPAASPRRASVSPRPRPPAAPEVAAPEVVAPELTLDRFRSPPPSPGEDPTSPPPAPRLLIARAGQPAVALVLAGDQIAGTIRGAPVALTLDGARLLGRLGSRNVWLSLRGPLADGDIGGIPVRFELVDIDGGHILREGFSVRTALSPQSTRVTETETSLAWTPGCPPLPRVAPGVYEGPCGRVVVPPAWQALPPLTRLILLSFFLTERDPAFARLFGPGG